MERGYMSNLKVRESTITSLEVAEMVGKEHKNLIRDIRTYCKQLGERKIEPSDFFTESTYQNSQNKTQPCYNVTKKGCEFVAHKMTGVKGTEFTAKYINRFHELEDAVKVPADPLAQIQLLAQGTIQLDKKIDIVAKDLEDFKQDLPVLGVELTRIKNAKNSKVVPLLGGKNAPAYKNKKLRGRVYSDLAGELHRQFGIGNVNQIKRSQTDKAIEVINTYELPMVLAEDIAAENAQQTLF